MKRVITYLSLIALVFSSTTRLYADPSYIEEEDCRRNNIGRTIAIATAIGLGAGIAWAVWASKGGGHNRCHSSCGSSSYCYSSYPYYYSDYSDSNHHHHHHHHNHHHHHDSNYSEFFSSSSSSESSFDIQSLPNHTKRSKDSKDKQKREVSGSFIAQPNLTSQKNGTMTPYVQLPDGSKRMLGTISLSNSSYSTLSFGPFDQKGTYTFGIRLEQGSSSPNAQRMGTIQIEVNGSSAQQHEFVLPAHAPANLELPSHSFEL